VGVVAAEVPEGGVSVLYTEEGGNVYLERSLPGGRKRSQFPPPYPDFVPQLALSAGARLYLFASGREQFHVVSRARGSSTWTASVQRFARLDTNTSFRACASGGTVRVVWDEADRLAPATGLYTATLRDRIWSAETRIPGTAYCMSCGLAVEDSVTGLDVACSESTLHVFWSTDRLGLRYTGVPL
jgi:hypothetical protein